MRVDEDGEFWLTMFVGAGIGLVSQLVSDLVTSAIEGEISFSHWTSYVASAVGGAVSAFAPYSYLGDIVGSAVTTIASAGLYNLESAIMGRDDYYSFEEVYYNTVNNIMISLLNGFMYENVLPIKNHLPHTKIWNTEIYLDQTPRGIGSSIFSGVKNAMDLPNTHIWDKATPERCYPF